VNDTQLLTRLAEANAYGKEAPLPETIWTSELALREIERRMGMKPTESPDQPTVTSGQQQQEAAPPPSAPDQVITAPQQRRRQGGRGPLVAIAAAVVVVLVIGAAAAILTLSGDGGDDVVAASPTPGPVTSFADIAGTTYERQGNGPRYLLFFEDGTFHSSSNPDLVVDRPSDVYTTRFDGTQVFITSPPSSRCPQPDQGGTQGGTYEIHLLEGGSVQFLAIDEDPCAQRSSFLQALDRDGVSAGGFVPVP
jgi:hypothetical protein